MRRCCATWSPSGVRLPAFGSPWRARRRCWRCGRGAAGARGASRPAPGRGSRHSQRPHGYWHLQSEMPCWPLRCDTSSAAATPAADPQKPPRVNRALRGGARSLRGRSIACSRPPAAGLTFFQPQQRLVLTTQQPRVHDPKCRANQTLRRQRGAVATPTLALPTALVQHASQTCEDPFATLERLAGCC